MDQDNEKEDRELTLQRDSKHSIDELERSLPRLLWKTAGSVRGLVRKAKTEQLIKLLEPFQEEPQLLDRHLSKIVTALVEAFLKFLTKHRNAYHELAARTTSSIIPLPRAVCRIVYILCKIRGFKIVSQLLSKEPQHLESMLDALQIWNHHTLDSQGYQGVATDTQMIWEERYVMLLWIAHLLLVPFDLASMSSDSNKTLIESQSQQVELPPDCPAIARRLILISCFYLGSASKEQEAAKMLLVRLALRTDMQNIGLHRILLDWALLQLDPVRTPAAATSINLIIGLLSFVSGLVTSATTAVLKPLLPQLFRAAERMKAIYGISAVSRKLLVKLYLGLAIHSIKASENQNDDLETAIVYLMEQLSASDTIVRFAASKALAKIALIVGPDMATQILDSVIESLNGCIFERNWDANANMTPYFSDEIAMQLIAEQLEDPDLDRANYNTANALEWHGLILTLSHFVFQRSVAIASLPLTIARLLQGLHFEQKNSLGTSVGTNVRDAACFGIWALGRKYSTNEIQGPSKSAYLLQSIAKELVVVAALDPAGNVRRGSSAALQELIGRHPNTIRCGNQMELLEIMDYHAVASRLKAMSEVATRASRVDTSYCRRLTTGLVSWRGCQFDDVVIRQNAAAKIRRAAGQTILQILVDFAPIRVESGYLDLVRLLKFRLFETRFSQVAQRHGLLYALTGLVSYLRGTQHRAATEQDRVLAAQLDIEMVSLWKSFEIAIDRSSSRVAKEKRDAQKSQFTLEAQVWLIRALAASHLSPKGFLGTVPRPSQEDLKSCVSLLSAATTSIGMDNADTNAFAIALLFDIESLIATSNEEPFTELFQSHVTFLEVCIQDLHHVVDAKRFGPLAFICLMYVRLSSAPPQLSSAAMLQRQILNTLLRETRSCTSIEMRVYSLVQIRTEVLKVGLLAPEILTAIEESLDDYTITNSRDVGSSVRKEAIETAETAIQRGYVQDIDQRRRMIAKICGLSVERINTVRQVAAKSLRENWSLFGLQPLYQTCDVIDESQTATAAYFETMLSLSSIDWIRARILEGFVTIAGNSSTDLLEASRIALIIFTSQLSQIALRRLSVCLVDILNDRVGDERLVIPILEVMGFLFEAGIFIRLDQLEFNWTRLFEAVEKAHKRSTNPEKLRVVVGIYGGLAQLGRPKIRALKKLCSLLKHRMPLVRNAAADALVVVAGYNTDVVDTDWNRKSEELKGRVDGIAARLLG